MTRHTFIGGVCRVLLFACVAAPIFAIDLALAANQCSSRDGQKYCTCEYPNLRCVDTETTCSCLPPGAIIEQPRQLPSATKPPPDENESAQAVQNYLKHAEVAIIQNKLREAINLIDKAQQQTRLLSGQDDAVRELTRAKQALLVKDRIRALEAIGGVLNRIAPEQ